MGKNRTRVLRLAIIICMMISVDTISNVQAAPLTEEVGTYQEEAAEVCTQAVRLMDDKDFSGVAAHVA